MQPAACALLRVFNKRRITLDDYILCAAICERRAVALHFRRQTVVSGRISSAPMTRALARVRSSLLAMLVGLFVLVSALLGCLPKAQAQDLGPDLGRDLSEAPDPGTTAAAFLEQALAARSDVMVVLDQSLSLYDPWNAGENRLQRVQRALPDALAALPDSARTGGGDLWPPARGGLRRYSGADQPGRTPP